LATPSQHQSGEPQDNDGSGSRASPASVFGKPAPPPEENPLPGNGNVASSARHHVVPGVGEFLSDGILDWEKVVDTLPFGLIVFNVKQEALYRNQTCLKLLGHDILDCDGVEDWLGKMCPDPDHKEKVISSWRRHVWRKKSTRIYTLKIADGKAREIEFRASIQEDGGLALMMQDVTLAKRTEDTVRLGKLKFRVLFSNLTDGAVLVDKSGRILDVNPAFLKFLELPLSDLRLTPISDLIHPRDAELLREAEMEILSKDNLSCDDKFRREVSLRTKSAEKRSNISFCPVVSHEGDYSMGVYIFQAPEPISLPENAAGKIKELAEKAQALLNAVPDLILLINRDKTIADFAAPAKPWEELPISEEWIGQPMGERWPTLGELLDQTYKRVFDQKKSIHAELHNNGNDAGSFIVTLAPCGKEQAMAVVQNITKIKSLEKSQRWHQQLFLHSKDAVIRADGEGIVHEINTAASELLGSSSEQVAGKKLSRYYTETSQQAEVFDRELTGHLSTKESWVSEQTLYGPDGSQEDVISLILPVENEGETLTLLNIISQKETPKEEIRTPQVEKRQHQFRNQLQMVTSLFALENQDKAGRSTGLKWQVRLRSLAQSYPYNDDGGVWVVPLLRSLADEVSSLSGRGPGCREIVITGPESLTISPEISTPFSLLAGEIMRMVISTARKNPGPKLYLDLERCAHGEVSLSVKPGSSGKLFSPSQQAEAETLEILAQQLRGQLRASQNAENVGSLQLIFDAQAG